MGKLIDQSFSKVKTNTHHTPLRKMFTSKVGSFKYLVVQLEEREPKRFIPEISKLKEKLLEVKQAECEGDGGEDDEIDAFLAYANDLLLFIKDNTLKADKPTNDLGEGIYQISDKTEEIREILKSGINLDDEIVAFRCDSLMNAMSVIRMLNKLGCCGPLLFEQVCDMRIIDGGILYMLFGAPL